MEKKRISSQLIKKSAGGDGAKWGTHTSEITKQHHKKSKCNPQRKRKMVTPKKYLATEPRS